MRLPANDPWIKVPCCDADSATCHFVDQSAQVIAAAAAVQQLVLFGLLEQEQHSVFDVGRNICELRKIASHKQSAWDNEDSLSIDLSENA
jgi:hypothetical protein